LQHGDALSPPVRGHWKLRKRIFPSLKKKIYREGGALAATYRIASKTNKSLALFKEILVTLMFQNPYTFIIN